MKKGITKFPHNKLIISNHKPLFEGFSLNKENSRKSFSITAYRCEKHSNKKNSLLEKAQNGQTLMQISRISGGQAILCENNNFRHEKRSNSQHKFTKVGMKNLNIHFRISQIVKKQSQQVLNPLSLSQNAQNSRQAQLFDKICKNLKKQFILQQNHIKSYTIKIDHLKNLLEYIYTYQYPKRKNHSREINLCKQSIFACINTELEQLYFLKDEKDLEEKKKSLCMQKSIDLFNFAENKFKLEKEAITISLLELYQEYQKTKSKIQGLTELIQLYKSQICIHQSSILQQIQVKTNLEQQIKLKKTQKALLQVQIENLNSSLLKLHQKGNFLKQFVSQQNNKLVLLASEDYKRIQQQIYDYASYLQSNQLASDLSYQPFPFQAIEDNILENMRQINKTIIQNVGISIQQKNRIMRDFILNSIDKFKKKDIELGKLLDFKTKCIRKFITQMQKWLDNWTLKQQYLVNLRNQFAYDNQMYKTVVDEAINIVTVYNDSEEIDKVLRKLMEVYNKIELNYKMGNTFY